MPVLIPIKFVCDHTIYGTPSCTESVDTTAPIKAKNDLSKSKIDLSYLREPEGWVIKLEDTSSGFGTRYDPELRCYCPKHSKEQGKK